MQLQAPEGTARGVQVTNLVGRWWKLLWHSTRDDTTWFEMIRR